MTIDPFDAVRHAKLSIGVKSLRENYRAVLELDSVSLLADGRLTITGRVRGERVRKKRRGRA